MAEFDENLGGALRGRKAPADGGLLYALEGELDLAGAEPLRERLSALIEGTSLSALILDLAALDFVDSSGLRALIAIREVLTLRGGALRLTNPTPEVRRLFDVTGTGALFDMTPAAQPS